MSTSVDPTSLYAAHIAHLQAAYCAALERTGYAALVVHSGSLAPKSRFDDQDWPFRPTPTFAHVAALAEPDAYLVLEAARRPRVLRCHAPSYWEGPPPEPGDWFFREVDVAEVAADALARELPAGRTAFIGEDTARGEALGLARERINPPALVQALDAIRTRKTDYERERIAEANRAAARGHRRVTDAFLAGEPASELALHLLYLDATGQDDADTPYKNIVALGAHAGVLHHVFYDRAAARGDQSLLVDAGAKAAGYASDVTRTTVRGDGTGARLFGQLVADVDRVQQEICRRVVVGRPYEALHDQAHELLAGVLREVGLVRASDEELVSSGATRKFLPHGLGHSLGIQVHDVGCRTTPPRQDNPFLRNTTTIEPGQVFTIEPGIYFIPELLADLRASSVADRVDWETIDLLAPFGGVRIEDNVAVLKDGIRNLTREGWQTA